MFNRYRLHNAALGGCLAALLLVTPALSQGENQDAAQEPQTQTADQTAIETQGATPPVTSAETGGGGHDDERQRQETEKPENAVSVFPVRVLDWIGQNVRGGDTYAQWFMAALGGVATIISVWAVVLLRQTLRATRDAIGEAERTTVIAEQTLEETRLSNERQLRAYVCVDSVGLRWENNRTAFAKVTVRNAGQTPAYQFTHINGLFVGTDDDGSEPPHISINDLGPGIEMHGTCISDPISDHDWDAVRKGTIPLYLVGDISYVDAFGKSRFVRYKLFFDADEKGLVPCTDGNESN